MTKFRLGVMNYFAVKRWPEPEKWTEIIVDGLSLGSSKSKQNWTRSFHSYLYFVASHTNRRSHWLDKL